MFVNAHECLERHQDKFLCALSCHWLISILVSLYPCVMVSSLTDQEDVHIHVDEMHGMHFVIKVFSAVITFNQAHRFLSYSDIPM